MSRDRVVQLAASSLALVLCRLEGTAAAAVEEEKGSQVFQDFQAANARCFWNRRLVRAVAEVSFQGWLESWVLLVQGQSANLEVLRDAWVRRALRPPRGFLITALGDVSPVQMNPVSQSQFIPLAEVLCCAISDMNATQNLVTQESLMEQLIKHYPGIATPSQEILYSTLGTLIKDRKIYHTGEGYFIVTPQTYFITRKPMSHSKCGAAPDNSVSPPAVTYLVSMESCADLTKANVSSVSHCRSCSCFSENSSHNILGQQSLNEGNGKEHKSVKDSKPSVQNQATSTSRDHHTCIKTKPQQSLKEKEKCNKKFGIGLFWRNVAKKEKSKKELVSFAAQFPPEEWPVRDEDNLDNIPRDIEHEIIKRINPVLTVDNLMKHTMMMQKAEEQKKYFSKGTSTDIMKNKNAHNLRGSNKKKNNRISKYHKKVQANKEKSRKDTNAPRLTTEVEKKSHNQFTMEDLRVPEVFTPGNVDGNQPEVMYKKQICNPFEGISYRESTNVGGCKPIKEVKKCRSVKDRKNLPRPKSLDCSGLNVKAGPRHLKAERPENEYCEELFHDQIVPINEKDDLQEYPSSYPQCSTLRIDDKFKHIKENGSALGLPREEGSPPFGDNQTNVLVKSERSWEHEASNLYSAVSYCNKMTSINESLQHAQTSLVRSINPSKCFGRSSVGAVEKNENASHGSYSASESSSKDLPKYTAFSSSHNEELVEEDQMFYKKEDNDGASSSFYFEGDTDEHIGTCQNIEMSRQNRELDLHNLYDLHEESHAAQENSPSHWDPSRALKHQFSSANLHQEDYTSSVFSSESSQSYTRPALHVKGSSCQPMSQYVLHHQVDVDTAECIQPELCEGSIFDYCNSSDCNSMAETVQTSIKGSDEKQVKNLGEQSGEGRTYYERTLKLFNTKTNPLEVNQNENHSTTGDSGIESPRTRISLASNNSVIFEKLKKRTFLQNLEVSVGNKNEGLLASSSIMQLTPAMNV
ncbi:storkhead-box protein 1 [Leptodactylus fuscus]|uniref:storkhead-box protein 1 n=1 Tax=Leptodactylus fuscus TaxID=238119 RepID=UPI003F4E9844